MPHSRSFYPALWLSAALFLAGSRPAAAAGDIVLYAGSATTVAGSWSRVSDSTAAGGARLSNPDAGAAKLTAPLASPPAYFEVAFTPQTGVAYHLWIRAKAQNDAWTNDSVFVQFSGSATAAGAAAFRIGTTSALVYSLEEDSGAGESGWGWQDTGYGYGVLGDPIYFSSTTQKIRIQVREDGISIDQIVLSPATYATVAPGAAKNDTTILPQNTGGTTTTTTPPPPTTAGAAVVWTHAVNAAVSGSSIKKTSGCAGCFDAGAVSQQQMTSGSASFGVTTGQQLIVGLGYDTSASTGPAIPYAFEFSGNAWEIRESGLYRSDGMFAASDAFSIAVDSGTVKYYRNGSLLYTSRVAVSGALALDTSMGTVGATVTNATLSGSTTTAPAPTDPAPSGSGVALRVLQWNTHHGGVGTDDVYDPNRLATWAASVHPDVVMFNEIEKNDYWGNQDQPEVYKSLLQQKTGKTWYYVFAQEFGDWTASGKGNLILSTYPISVQDRYELVHNADRSIAAAVITVNSRDITLISTHLDPYDATLRLTQATEVSGWAASQPENRIITGDMNAWPDQTSIAKLDSLYYDSWVVASANGTATAFPGNNGETKNGRIDYIFYSKGSSNLTVTSSRVIDTRDSSGIMPSDHRPVFTVFSVR
jgi:endonuclease/exonuclease/phosphatase family metal-dependent hydrolase